MTDRKNVLAILVFFAVLSGGIFAIHSYHEKEARAQEAARVKTEQRRLAQEEESKRIEMEAEQERARVAQEQEQEEKRLAEAKDQEQKRLAHEAEQKRLAEMEQERILSQIPVVLNSNNFVVLSFGKGTLWDCNGDGLQFRENRLDPRTPWAMLTEADARAVLGTQEGFDAATQFDPKGNTNFDDPDLAQQLGTIWRQGQTLNERLTTRMEILGICEKYNKTRARYIAASVSSVGYDVAAQKAKQQANDADRAYRAAYDEVAQIANQQADIVAAYAPIPSLSPHLAYVRPNMPGSSTGMLDFQIMGAASASSSQDRTKANQYSQASSTQSAYATTAEGDLNECLVRLAKLGLKLTDSGAYPIIPPMNLRREIALELNSNPIPK